MTSLVGVEVSTGGVAQQGAVVKPIPEDDEEEEDYHAPPTPPGAAEMLFMDNMLTHNASAAYVAQEIHDTIKSEGGGSAIKSLVSFLSEKEQGEKKHASGYETPPDPDILKSLEMPGHETDDDGFDDDDDDELDNDVMLHPSSENSPYIVNSRDLFVPDTVTASKMSSASAKTPAPAPAPAKEETVKVDPISHAFGGIKNVWNFNKENIIVFKPFIAAAEFVADKVLDVAGKTRDDVDKGILNVTNTVDEKVCNPIINFYMSIANATVVPVAKFVGSPFGLLKDGEKTTATTKK